MPQLRGSSAIRRNALLWGEPMLTHREIDLKSLALHRLVAQKVAVDPALFMKAQATLSRMHDQGKVPLTYLTTWSDIFAMGWQAAMAAATEDSERGQTLRTCSPFAGLLSEQERLAFLAQWATRDGHDSYGHDAGNNP